MSVDELIEHCRGVKWFLTPSGQIRMIYGGDPTCPICYVGFKLNENPSGHNLAFGVVSLRLKMDTKDTITVVETADNRVHTDRYDHQIREKLLSLLT